MSIEEIIWNKTRLIINSITLIIEPSAWNGRLIEIKLNTLVNVVQSLVSNIKKDTNSQSNTRISF